MPITFDACGDAPDDYCDTSTSTAFKKCVSGSCSVNAEGHVILSNPNANLGDNDEGWCNIRAFFQNAFSFLTGAQQENNNLYSFEIELEANEG